MGVTNCALTLIMLPQTGATYFAPMETRQAARAPIVTALQNVFLAQRLTLVVLIRDRQLKIGAMCVAETVKTMTCVYNRIVSAQLDAAGGCCNLFLTNERKICTKSI